MMPDVSVTMKRGNSANVDGLSKVDGQILFAKDTGEMYIDVNVGNTVNRVKVTDPDSVIDDGSID